MSYFNLSALTAPMTTAEGLTHAVRQSVLNHGLSTANDCARMGSAERGGCWSDEFIMGTGSRDWTLKREKVTAQTIGLAKRFYEEALAWLVHDKHVKTITVDVFKLTPTTLGRNVVLTLNDDAKVEVTL